MISIVIRTLNEARYLAQALEACRKQVDAGPVEIVIVDSGSTDETLKIAQSFDCKIVHIRKDEFSFGRSLNLGCAAAQGEFLVFISGHCVPSTRDWLKNLVEPLRRGTAAYTYGRQVGGDSSRFSETRLFLKYFPESSRIPQEGFFCNNANAALLKSQWVEQPFDEELTGLEDMDLAKRLWNRGLKIAYCADAPVYHYHHEQWKSVRRRYEREAIALQKIMPEIHVSFLDFIRYYLSAVFMDFGAAIENRCFWDKCGEILLFRLMQFWGSYRGNHEHRKLSRMAKEVYFYPKGF
ncbi:MAG TPA: glycosyltransferase [Bdellovibrionota bacterium]|jgi:glycosyltransferase involved in cell wall biosynthesis|nr:glycosyltransferase [Bdellovibrionota bacterium]